jgi:hypothetical protein
MEAIIEFMASTAGRIARIVAGIVLIALGVNLGDNVGMIITIIGGVPILMGLFDICLLAPLAGMSTDGAVIRARK